MLAQRMNHLSVIVSLGQKQRALKISDQCLRCHFDIERRNLADLNGFLDGQFEIHAVTLQDVANAISNRLIERPQLRGQIAEGTAQNHGALMMLGYAIEESIETLQWADIGREHRLQDISFGALPLRIQYRQSEVMLGREEVIEAAFVYLRGDT